MICRFFRVNFPPDNLPAEDVHDQIEIEELPGYGALQVRDVPTPDLVGSRCGMRCWPFSRRDRRTPPSLCLTCTVQDSVEGRSGCDVDALIHQRWDNLAWRKVLESFFIAGLQDPSFLFFTQLVGWNGAVGAFSTIFSNGSIILPPPLKCPYRYPEDLACRFQPGAGFHCMLDRAHGRNAIRVRSQPSSVSPQIARAFFANTSKAAVSASALSLRFSSRLRFLMAFLSFLCSLEMACCREADGALPWMQAVFHSATCSG